MSSVRKVYYRLVNRLADVNLPIDAGDFELVDRKVLDAMRQFDDYYPYVRGMVASCGFRSVGIEYTWRARQRGVSKNRLYNLIDQGLNGIVSFTNVPMRIAMGFGLSIAVLSILYAMIGVVGGLIQLIFFDQPMAARGIPTLIVAVFFFGGVQLFFLGVLGEYLCATHSQVRKGPLVIERERINF